LFAGYTAADKKGRKEIIAKSKEFQSDLRNERYSKIYDMMQYFYTTYAAS